MTREMQVGIDAMVVGDGGEEYAARVNGREAEDGLWEAWIEFERLDGAGTLRTRLETRQPNRPDLEYWVSGLTPSYLEGALARASRTGEAAQPPSPASAPAEDPHPAVAGSERPQGPPRVRPRAVLDPFKVYRQGEHVLREELSALDEHHLRDIIRAHDLARESEPQLEGMGRQALTGMIVAGVRRRAGVVPPTT